MSQQKPTMTKYDPQRHHRRSIRLKGYDYTQPGAYFVTICACQRESLFGQIVDGEMELSRLGEMVKHEWFRSAQLRDEIMLHDDEFVLMPNHIHGIVHIVEVEADGVRPDGVRPDARDRADPVGADGIRPGDADSAGAHDRGVQNQGAHDQGAHRAPLRAGRSLGSFVAGFKAAVSSRAARELNLSNVWQRNYYEHIIRDEAEYAQIHAYIQTNPLRWEADQLHPAAPPNRFNQE